MTYEIPIHIVRATERLSTRFDTSDDAFAAAPSGAAALVLEAIRNQPRTVDELMVDLSMSHSTCSAAVNKLMRQGWVSDSGIRAMTRAGRKAIVWEPNLVRSPIVVTRPTRKELETRVHKALLALAAKADASCVERILRGEPHA